MLCALLLTPFQGCHPGGDAQPQLTSARREETPITERHISFFLGGHGVLAALNRLSPLLQEEEQLLVVRDL